MRYLIIVMLLGNVALAATEQKAVKYRKAKELDFEKLLIEGDLRRPDFSVVTGETEDPINGLLRLREDFVDQVAVDAGEELP